MSYPRRIPVIVDRIIAVLTYLTMGFVGCIWYVVCAIMRLETSDYLKYHILQSIFMAFTLFIFNWVLKFINDFFSIIPFVKVLVQQVVYLLNMPIFMNYSIIQTLVYLILAYSVATSAFGLYTYIPFISDIISQNLGRK